MFATWREFYQSDLQSVYALWLVPAFVIETVLDPYVTGPLLRWLSVEEPDATLCRWLFALLGGFRAYLLVFYVLEPRRGARLAIGRAARWTLFAPIIAVAGCTWLQCEYGPLPSGAMQILYEAGSFFVMRTILTRILPATTDLRRFEVRQYVGALVRYVALHYALWAIADLLIVVWAVDWAWALRAIPNQLYYSLLVPYAYFTFFSPRYAVIHAPSRALRRLS